MELLKSWWEKLGLKSKDAVVLESLLNGKQSVAIPCSVCGNYFNSTDFHDCAGRYDELRLRVGNASNTVIRRLKTKYNGVTDWGAASTKYLDDLPKETFDELVTSYHALLKQIEEQDPTWHLEEELWNS
jgi:hypothetical protein